MISSRVSLTAMVKTPEQTKINSNKKGFYRTENLYTVVDWYVSPGRSVVVGKLG